MKTNDLIEIIAQDLHPRLPFGTILRQTALIGVSIAALAFFAFIGFRADIGSALQTGRFLFKFVVTLALVVSAWLLFKRVGRPGVPLTQVYWILLLPLALLGVGAIAEVSNLPSDAWMSSAVGTNAGDCLFIIPLLSIGPLACLLYGLRQGAAENAGKAGFVAGLLAAGMAATFYAANCDDDSPLFVLTWYPLATAIVGSMGYFAGRAVLRW